MDFWEASTFKVIQCVFIPGKFWEDANEECKKECNYDIRVFKRAVRLRAIAVLSIHVVFFIWMVTITMFLSLKILPLLNIIK